MKPAPPVMRIGRSLPTFIPPTSLTQTLNSADQPSRFELGARLVDMIFRALAADPLGQLGEALVKILLGPKAEDFRGSGRVTKAVANVAGAALADDFRLDVVAVESASDRARNFLDAPVLARTDVENLAVRLGMDQSVGEGARYVADVNEVPPLLPILEDHRPLTVLQARREDRENAGVRVRQRLPRAIDVEQPQARALHAVGLGHDERLALLHIFPERVDRREAGLLPLRRRQGLQRTA